MKDKYLKSYVHKGKRPKGKPPINRKKKRKLPEINEDEIIRRKPVMISESPAGFDVILFCLIWLFIQIYIFLN